MSRNRTRLTVAAVIAGSVLAALPLSPAYAPPACDPSWRYDITRKGASLMPLKRLRNENNTGSYQTAHFTARQSYTREWHVIASVSAAAKAAIFAEIKATVSGGVRRSVTTGYDNTQDLRIPPRRVGHGTFGIFHAQSYGKLYSITDRCSAINEKRGVRARAPKAEGWRVWITRR